MSIIAGVDLGGTAVNYTLIDMNGRFLIEDLFEHPARSVEGPEVCLQQIADGLALAVSSVGRQLGDVAVIGLDTPGPASATGVLSAEGSTNFVHADWAGFDLPAGLARKLDRPVTYLNDGNAGALWGHVSLFGTGANKTSISAIVGTGLGGGVIVNDQVIKGRMGFGGELGHVLLPYQSLPGLEGVTPLCNTLLPHFLKRHPGHELGTLPVADAAKKVRGRAEKGDAMCREIFRVQAQALGMFFDQMINTFDPDALVVGGGVIEASEEFRHWFIGEIRAGMPPQRTQQAGIPIHLMPNGDTAGARGAAIDALAFAKSATFS
jgi:glucokinase